MNNFNKLISCQLRSVGLRRGIMPRKPCRKCRCCPLRTPTLQRLWLAGGIPRTLPTRGRDPVAPLRAISGTEDNRLSPHLQILPSMSQVFHNEPSMGTAVLRHCRSLVNSRFPNALTQRYQTVNSVNVNTHSSRKRICEQR